MTDRILLLLGITLMYSTPMVFAAQGSVISEVSGVVNIGIEGMMTVGAFTGATVGYYTGSPWLGFICAGLAGAFFGLIHAFASVTCKSDQTVCGIAMNLVGPGVALFLCRLFFDGATQSLPVTYKIPKLFRGGLSGSLNNLNVDVTTLIALILSICMMILFYRTSWGMHLRAVGEHPGAADTLGINVYKVRYICVILSGFLAGLGHQVGIVLVKAEDILRELLHGDFFNDIFDTVFIILVGQVDGQPFARMQGEFPDLARDGITSVHQDSAADAVQGLGAGIHCILSILAILPILAVLSVLAVLAILSGRGG